MERGFCKAQRDMYFRPNRWFVSPAAWTAQQFSQHYAVPEAQVLPSWVESIERRVTRNARPVVLGDFRTVNKGSDVIARLRDAVPNVEVRLLSFTYEQRKEVYAHADAYLCLSMSEGGSSRCRTPKPPRLPLITPDVGNYLEYGESQVIPWQTRDDTAFVARALERALSTPRGPSFFESWTFDKWRKTWRTLLEQVADVKQREPVLGTASESRALVLTDPRSPVGG